MKFFHKIRTSILIIVLLAVIPAAALIVHSGMENRVHLLNETKKNAHYWSEQGTQQLAQVIDGLQQILLVISREDAVRRFNAPAANRHLSDLLARFDHLANLGVTDIRGTAALSGVPIRKPVHLEQRLYVKRALNEKKFVCGEYQIGKITGVSTINCGQPMFDDDEQMIGIVYAALKIEHLHTLLSKINLPEGSDLTLLDMNGTVLYSRLIDLHQIGEPFSQPSIIAAGNDSGGEFNFLMGRDGVKRYYSIGAPKQIHGMRLLVGLPESYAVGKANQAMIRNLALLGGSSLLAIGLAWFLGNLFIMKRIRALVRAVDDMAAGVYSTRTEPSRDEGELGHLAAAFDRMAGALQIRDRELRESEKQYRTVVENMNDVIAILDVSLRFTYVSPSIMRLCGLTVEEMLTRSLDQVLTPESFKLTLSVFDDEMIQEARGVSNPQRTRTLELEVYTKDRATIWAEANLSFMRDEKNKPVGILSTSRDITDRKRAQEEARRLEVRLQRSEKMEALGQLAGGVAHDLNNVLGAMTGYAELLLLEASESHRSKVYAEKILRSTEKGAAIIQDLLTLARRGVMVSDVLNLNNIISDFIRTPMFERIRDYHPLITFRTEYDQSLLNIRGSLVHLEKTLMNLVSNAAESIPGRGDVVIRTENRYLDKPLRGYDEVKEGDYALLIVSDTGTGIAAEDAGRLFEPFYTKKIMGRSGTGLGLSVVWGTVKDHSGYIDVASQIGEGSVFTLFFPVTREEKDIKPARTSIEQYMGNGECILVIDDVADQRDIANRMLTRLGYRVDAVASGEEALKYLTTKRADLLVLDMIMEPGMDGLATYQRALSINSKQKAILVSGFSETERIRQAQKLGAGAYVKKPYMMETIGMAVRDELRRN